jgi:hypothetical protein
MTAAIFAFAKWAWGFIRPVLTFGITLPVWFFLAAGLWLAIDRASAVRTAVNDAVVKLVAGAQIEGLQATVLEYQRINAWQAGKADEASRIADDARAARADLSAKLTVTDEERKALADDLQAVRNHYKSLPAGAGRCVVDQFLFDRLRNK